MNSTLTGEKIGMTIDDQALSHIMSVLTDLYSDPEAAVVREYSTNALDAHVEAGITRPIDVTIPSALSPFLRIRDYGYGLNEDDIREVYSRYGTSTKRESNEVVGMLGLGCKSALTYTDQFTLTSVKDEVQTTVSVSRDADGAGSMTLVSQESTSAESGTEVIIPAKRGHNFEHIARNFFRYWDTGKVLVNGKEPARIGSADEGMWVTPEIFITDDVDENMIVMGNVAYPAPSLKLDRLAWRARVVAWVPIGTVLFTPSREALQDTASNRAAIAALKGEVEWKMDASFEAQINNAPTPFEALQARTRAEHFGFRRDATWNNKAIPRAFDRGHGSDAWLFVPGTKKYRRKDGFHEDVARADAILYNTFVDNFPHRSFTPTMRLKLEKYRADNALDTPVTYVMVDKLDPAERFWIPKERILDWTPVEAVKIERTHDGIRKPKGSYSGYYDGKWVDSFLAEDIDTTKPVYWINANRWTAAGHQAVKRGLMKVDHTLVTLPANRVDKFQRDFPKAKALDTLWQEHLDKVWDGFTKDEIAALTMNRTARSTLRLLDENMVNDPDIQRWIRIAKIDLSGTKKSTYSTYCVWASPPSDPAGSEPFKKYPLLTSGLYLGSAHVRHVTIYLNAAYAAERG